MGKHVLPELNFDFHDFEPYIDAKTMDTHYNKHHAAYVNKLNLALEKYPVLFADSLPSLLMNLSSLPEDIRKDIQNNGGGHLNHSMFWSLLRTGEKIPESGEFYNAICKTFGSMQNFMKVFESVALSHFGSGWAWLSVNVFGKIMVHSTSNQDNPLMQGLNPVFGLDLWEHAYYLQYQNRRNEYVKAFWNVFNWSQAEANYVKAMKDREFCVPHPLMENQSAMVN